MRRTARHCLIVCALALVSTACTGNKVKDPHDAALAFARALGNPDAMYDLLTPEAQKALSRDDVKRLLLSEKPELTETAKAIADPGAHMRATARLRFDDGEEVALDLARDHFAVTSAGTLPGAARTPEAALEELRRALARRSYPRLLRLLSPTTRSMIEQDLRTLVNGLEHPETLPIHTSGDAASAVTPGGHHVTMKREAGLWRVEDFD